jgi:hypothetical protein
MFEKLRDVLILIIHVQFLKQLWEDFSFFQVYYKRFERQSVSYAESSSHFYCEMRHRCRLRFF